MKYWRKSSYPSQVLARYKFLIERSFKMSRSCLSSSVRRTCMQSIETNIFNWRRRRSWNGGEIPFNSQLAPIVCLCACCVRKKLLLSSHRHHMNDHENGSPIRKWFVFFAEAFLFCYFRLFTCNFYWFFSSLLHAVCFQACRYGFLFFSCAINLVCHNLTDFFLLFFFLSFFRLMIDEVSSSSTRNVDVYRQQRVLDRREQKFVFQRAPSSRHDYLRRLIVIAFPSFASQ